MAEHKLSRRQVIQGAVAGAGAAAASSLMPGIPSALCAPPLRRTDDRGILIIHGTGSSMPENFNPLIDRRSCLAL